MSTTDYFAGVRSLKSAAKRWRELAKRYHPDVSNADTSDIMAIVNSQYQALIVRLKTSTANRAQKPKTKRYRAKAEKVRQELERDRIIDEEFENLNDTSSDPLRSYLSDDEFDRASSTIAGMFSTMVELGIKTYLRRDRSRRSGSQGK